MKPSDLLKITPLTHANLTHLVWDGFGTRDELKEQLERDKELGHVTMFVQLKEQKYVNLYMHPQDAKFYDEVEKELHPSKGGKHKKE